MSIPSSSPTPGSGAGANRPNNFGANRAPFGKRPNSNGPRGPRPPRVREEAHRRNDRIRVMQVRVVGPSGQQLGVLDTFKAIALARECGLDLVEVAPNAEPPVCRICDYGKFLYEEAKKTKHQKQATTKMKEVKIRPRCDIHDLMIKVKRGENFLYHGNKLKITLQFRYRELEHPEVGYNMMKKAVEELAHIGTADNKPVLQGRSMTVTMTPVPQVKRKLIHNEAPGAEDDEDDSSDDDGDDE